ncbi:metallophosphoesterase family protein [Rubritalea sp.]|uniref:metallophosphoesterase family protein n=1 Tax=Rubritalea sp. TaxID=2109375 RepID=UPI003EF08F42
MSKTALFSDIHANLNALEAVINDAKSQGVQNFACLGDVVGYGPNPIDCIAAVQAIDCVCVKGNHDEDASNDRVLDNLNDQARASLEWTRSMLSESQKSWLANLPYKRRLGRNMLVHAALENPGEWEYLRNSFDAEIAMLTQPTPICFFGHTHKPVTYTQKGKSVSVLTEQEIELHPDQKYLINVGSVGQPRDGIPEASYVVFDREKRTINFRRVKYDIHSVVQQITESGLPLSLGDRLISAA